MNEETNDKMFTKKQIWTDSWQRLTKIWQRLLGLSNELFILIY